MKGGFFYSFYIEIYPEDQTQELISCFAMKLEIKLILYR